MSILRRKKYPEKEIWEKFMSMGAAASNPKIRNWLMLEKGIKPSQMGHIWAMWRYAVKNPEKAYPLYKVWHFEYASSISGVETVVDPNVNFEGFLKDCQYRIKQSGDSIMSKSAYKRFCQKYNLAE